MHSFPRLIRPMRYKIRCTDHPIPQWRYSKGMDLPYRMANILLLKLALLIFSVTCAHGTRPIRRQNATTGLDGFYDNAGLPFGGFVESLQFLFPQNYARAKVGEFPLLWDFKVEGYARWWAEQRKGDCQMIHSHGPYGENIFWGSGQDWTPLDAVKFWVEEKEFYSYDTNACAEDQMCGHYTQIVWRDTRRMGCARVACDNGDVFMTCNYDPPGNYIGEKPY